MNQVDMSFRESLLYQQGYLAGKLEAEEEMQRRFDMLDIDKMTEDVAQELGEK